MRLWFCSPGCLETYADGPRPWLAEFNPDRCPVCDEPRPLSFVYLVANAGLGDGYLYQWTIRPFIQSGGFLIVRAEGDWKIAAWEHLASGLQLGTTEIFDDPVDALRVARSLEARNRGRGAGYLHPIWPLVVLRDRRWQLDLARYSYDDPEPGRPEVGCHFTLLQITNARQLTTSVRMNGEARTYRDLFTAVGSYFPGRFRTALARSWLDLGLAA